MSNQASLSFVDVVRLLGDVSGSTIERVLETGGTCADLEIAYFCLMGDNDRQEGQLGALDGKTALIFDILRGDPMLAPVVDR